MRRFILISLLGSLGLFFISSCANKPAYYTASDFYTVPKIDVHFHYNTTDIRYLEYADSLHFRLLSPNVDTDMPIDEQLAITSALRKRYSGEFFFLGTFSVDSFNYPGFAEKTIACIDKCMKAGASGIKIWKNIGMELKDTAGYYVMADNPAFAPVFRYLEVNKIPVLAHLGEPKNCWLPEEKMTLDNDRRYYQKHPQYHMYLHPDAPTYEQQIDARDDLLKEYPGLNLAGAHLGSMEWDVNEVAKRLDQFPNFQVEFSARIGHLQYQAITNRKKVRDFMIRYQDRIMYGTDVTLHSDDTACVAVKEGLLRRWKEQWLFLATDSVIPVKDLGGKEVKGLQLPREVIDKIYCKNAERFFGINKSGKQ